MGRPLPDLPPGRSAAGTLAWRFHTPPKNPAHGTQEVPKPWSFEVTVVPESAGCLWGIR